MKTFKGFTETETFTQIPDTFFHQLLKQIDGAAELKITLYFLWHVQHMDGPYRALRESDLDAKGLGLSTEEIHSGLEKAVQRGSILRVKKDSTEYFLLNSPRGRATSQAMESGSWTPEAAGSTVVFERPNIFRLYEENIGPLTPLIADALKDAEETYSAEWVAEAIEAAVKYNKRSWKYCESILKRRKEDGSGQRQDRRNAEKVDRNDVQKRVDDFFRR